MHGVDRYWTTWKIVDKHKKEKKNKINRLKEEKQIKTCKICFQQKMLIIKEQIALTFCTLGLMPTNFFFSEQVYD